MFASLVVQIPHVGFAPNGATLFYGSSCYKHVAPLERRRFKLRFQAEIRKSHIKVQRSKHKVQKLQSAKASPTVLVVPTNLHVLRLNILPPLFEFFSA
jgi:hypothetical protein